MNIKIIFIVPLTAIWRSILLQKVPSNHRGIISEVITMAE